MTDQPCAPNDDPGPVVAPDGRKAPRPWPLIDMRSWSPRFGLPLEEDNAFTRRAAERVPLGGDGTGDLTVQGRLVRDYDGPRVESNSVDAVAVYRQAQEVEPWPDGPVYSGPPSERAARALRAALAPLAAAQVEADSGVVRVQLPAGDAEHLAALIAGLSEEHAVTLAGVARDYRVPCASRSEAVDRARRYRAADESSEAQVRSVGPWRKR